MHLRNYAEKRFNICHFSFFTESIGRVSSLDEEYRSSLRRSFGGRGSRVSVWDKCSKQSVLTDGVIKCDINNGRGNYPIETAVCTATCRDGYLLIGTTFDFFMKPLYLKILSYLISTVIWGNKEAICPHWKGSPVHDWNLELGDCIPDPPVTDCSIVVTNDASTDIFLRVATKVRSRWAKSLIKRRINVLLAPQLGKT